MWETHGKLGILFFMLVMLSCYEWWFLIMAAAVLCISIWLGYDKTDNW